MRSGVYQASAQVAGLEEGVKRRMRLMPRARFSSNHIGMVVSGKCFAGVELFEEWSEGIPWGEGPLGGRLGYFGSWGGQDGFYNTVVGAGRWEGIFPVHDVWGESKIVDGEVNYPVDGLGVRRVPCGAARGVGEGEPLGCSRRKVGGGES